MDYTMNKKLLNLSKILFKINLPYEALFISKLANNEELTREQEDKLIDRYIKILAHAESGVGNEKAAAQKIADSWPESIDDHIARTDWGWQEKYNLERLVVNMLDNLR